MTSRQSERSDASKGGHYYADAGKNRAQRHTLALRDVAYIIRAAQKLAAHTADPLIKYREQFLRKVKKGQYFQHPYFGCREFPAHFGPLDGSEKPIVLSDDMGLMLFDIKYSPDPGGKIKVCTHNGEDTKLINAEAMPVFFRARLENGILHVPKELYSKGGQN